jgi:hypothetical protein
MNAPAVKKQSQRSQSMNTPEVRIAFPFLHEKRVKNAAQMPLKSPRYDATLLLPKLSTDPSQCANYKFLSDLCMEAAGKMWPGVGWPAGGIWPIKDGDVPYVAKAKPGVTPKTPEQIAAANAWRVGHWVVEVTNFLDVGPKVCVLQNGTAVEIPAKMINGVMQYKSGDFGIAHISAYAYENEQWGTNFSVEGILFTRPGDPIGSSGPRSASQMFGSVAPVANAAAPGVPPLPPSAAPPLAPAVPTAPHAAAPATAPMPTASAVPPSSAPPLPPMPPMPNAAPPLPIPSR